MVTVGNILSAYANHTYRAELFPTPPRGRAIGIIYSLDRLAAAFSSYLIGFILVAGGVTGLLVCVAAFSILIMAVGALWGPRTRPPLQATNIAARPMPPFAGPLE